MEKIIDSRVYEIFHSLYDIDKIRHRNWILISLGVLTGFYMLLVCLSWIFVNIPFWLKVTAIIVLSGMLFYLYQSTSFSMLLV